MHVNEGTYAAKKLYKTKLIKIQLYNILYITQTPEYTIITTTITYVILLKNLTLYL